MTTGAERQAKYRKAHPERVRERRATAEYRHKAYAAHKRYREADPARTLYHAAKARAKKGGLPLDIEYSDVVIPERCPALGVPLQRKGRFAPSLDRVYNDRGYVKGNVVVVSRKANAMKQDATAEELEKVARFYNQWRA